MDPFSAQKSGQKLQQKGISKFGRHQCCIVGAAALGRFSQEILRKIDIAPTQYPSLLPVCIVYSDRIPFLLAHQCFFRHDHNGVMVMWCGWWLLLVVDFLGSIG
jgi:hypothetical protein